MLVTLRSSGRTPFRPLRGGSQRLPLPAPSSDRATAVLAFRLLRRIGQRIVVDLLDLPAAGEKLLHLPGEHLPLPRLGLQCTPFQKVLLGSSLLAGLHRRFIFNLHLIDFIDTAVVEVVFRQVIIIFDIVFAHTSPPRKTRAIYSATERFEKRAADDFLHSGCRPGSKFVQTSALLRQTP